MIVRAFPNSSDEVRDMIGGRIGKQIENDGAVGRFQMACLFCSSAGGRVDVKEDCAWTSPNSISATSTAEL